MDSDDEQYDATMPDIPLAHKKLKVFGEIDFSALVANGGGYFDEAPVPAEGEAEGAAAKAKPEFNKRMWDEMSPKYLSNKDREVLQTMTGDFEEIERMMENVVEDGSVKKVMLKPGTGRKLEVGDLVSIHYIMNCEHSDEPFDSTYVGLCRPRRFRVAAGDSIMLMEHSLTTMRVGEEAKFLGTPNVCYGKLGCPDQGILPNARVLIQIKVLEVCAKNAEIEVLAMSNTERAELPFEQLFNVAVQLKNKANREYQSENYDRAAILYHEMYECLQTMAPITDDDTARARNLTWQMYNNMCLNYMKMGKMKRAFRCAEKGSEIRGLANLQKAKPLYLCAKAMLDLGESDVAYDYIKKAVTFSCDQDIKNLKKKIEERRMVMAALEKERCERMMKGIAVGSERYQEAEVKKTAAVEKMMNMLNLQK